MFLNDKQHKICHNKYFEITYYVKIHTYYLFFFLWLLKIEFIYTWANFE